MAAVIRELASAFRAADYIFVLVIPPALYQVSNTFHLIYLAFLLDKCYENFFEYDLTKEGREKI